MCASWVNEDLQMAATNLTTNLHFICTPRTWNCVDGGPKFLWILFVSWFIIVNCVLLTRTYVWSPLNCRSSNSNLLSRLMIDVFCCCWELKRRMIACVSSLGLSLRVSYILAKFIAVARVVGWWILTSIALLLCSPLINNRTSCLAVMEPEQDSESSKRSW